MRAKLARHTNFENPFRTGLTLSVALASLLSLSVPSSARDGGAIAADVIDALGRAATPHAAPPPPPQPRIKYVPVYVQPPRRAPRHCWYEGREVYDGEDYVAKKVKVCQ
jgi:hypothetical protein